MFSWINATKWKWKGQHSVLSDSFSAKDEPFRPSVVLVININPVLLPSPRMAIESGSSLREQCFLYRNHFAGVVFPSWVWPHLLPLVTRRRCVDGELYTFPQAQSLCNFVVCLSFHQLNKTFPIIPFQWSQCALLSWSLRECDLGSKVWLQVNTWRFDSTHLFLDCILLVYVALLQEELSVSLESSARIGSRTVWLGSDTPYCANHDE